MSASLPRHPSVNHLKKQAKMLLGTQRRRIPACCALLRRLHRFAAASDEEILEATLSLAEVQLALAMHYGYSGWKEMIGEARSHPAAGQFSLEAVRDRGEETIPDYAGAGVPLAVVASLNHAGIPIRFMEFAAASGWSFSFGYLYDDVSPAYMAVRGDPAADGPLEVFAFLPSRYGLGYASARTQDPSRLWSFVKKHVDSGIPIMSEHLDGGLITAYRMQDGRRQLFFDGTVAPGWIDAGGLQPHAVYVFVKEREARPRGEITRAALERAAAKGQEHTWRGVPQGLAALRGYLADVRDLTRNFARCGEWFCWAAFERLMARRCAEIWLRSLAEVRTGEARRWLAAAADGYGEAFRGYDRYRAAVQAGEPPGHPLPELVRTPERVGIIVPLLERAIAAEARGLEALQKVLCVLD
jgi:hypothetical protein